MRDIVEVIFAISSCCSDACELLATPTTQTQKTNSVISSKKKINMGWVGTHLSTIFLYQPDLHMVTTIQTSPTKFLNVL